MFTEKSFIIDGIPSSEINVDDCVLIRDNPQINRQIMGNKSIVENKLHYSDIPTFIRTEKQPMEFTLMVSFLDTELNKNKLIELNKIFSKDIYVPFESSDYPNVVFYVIATSIELVTFSNFKGWYQINLRCNAPHAWLKEELLSFDLSEITEPTIIEIENKTNVMHPKWSNYIYEPELWIYMQGNETEIKLENLSDNGRIFEFIDLNIGEELYIHNRKKQIESNVAINRLANLFNKNWFRLVDGVNEIKVYNKCMLQIRTQFPIYV